MTGAAALWGWVVDHKVEWGVVQGAVQRNAAANRAEKKALTSTWSYMRNSLTI